ncbi:uncharacterized protein LOC120699545 isoform X4 [Panicum virgatum]|uniref:uncharacterized protein LOC120699545 isoform X4 n=1 Tax=Panicum virgatum TaxID=38727 RepID=UPI0019D5EFF6|nr:uncharacterized protein LOC120699545 isoform X4 [Panicum virgatum]
MARPLRSFCLHRIRSGGGGAAAPTAAPPSICGAKEAGSSDGEGKSSLKGAEEDEEAMKKGGTEAVAVVVGRKVMVAADGGSEEARTALHWALSHAVRPCDTLVLLDVVRGGGKNRRDPRGCQHLEAMRSICQAKRPEVIFFFLGQFYLSSVSLLGIIEVNFVSSMVYIIEKKTWAQSMNKLVRCKGGRSNTNCNINFLPQLLTNCNVKIKAGFGDVVKPELLCI